MSPGSSMDVNPEREVKRIHLLLEDWYCGIRDDITAIEDALAPNVTLVDAEGRIHSGDEVVSALSDRREAAIHGEGPASLSLRDIQTRRELYGIHHVTFTKDRVLAGENDIVTCSLWFRETNRVTSGLQWLHLQETPVIERDEDQSD